MSAFALVVPVLYAIRYDDYHKYFIEFVPQFDKWRVRKDTSHNGRIVTTYLTPETRADGTPSLVFYQLSKTGTDAVPILYDYVELALEGWQTYIQQFEKAPQSYQGTQGVKDGAFGANFSEGSF